jgi:hypothetical protein
MAKRFQIIPKTRCDEPLAGCGNSPSCAVNNSETADFTDYADFFPSDLGYACAQDLSSLSG